MSRPSESFKPVIRACLIYPISFPKTHLKAGGYFELEMFEEAERGCGFADDDPWLKKKKVFQAFDRKSRIGQICGYEGNFAFFIRMKKTGGYRVVSRRSETIEEARKILLDGLAVHYDSAIIRYNLACYACVLGHPGECLDFLKEAVRRDGKYKEMAMEDEDLEAVKEALKSLGWGSKIV